MLKVKIFESANSVELESNVNKWLFDNREKDIYIINTTQSETSFGTNYGKYHNVTFTIIYKVD
jgi:hypothetical protein